MHSYYITILIYFIDLESVEINNMQESESINRIFVGIQSIPMKILARTAYSFKGMNEAGLKMKIGVLTLLNFYDHVEAFLFNNFSASEIRLHEVYISRSNNIILIAYRENKLKFVLLPI